MSFATEINRLYLAFLRFFASRAQNLLNVFPRLSHMLSPEFFCGSAKKPKNRARSASGARAHHRILPRVARRSRELTERNRPREEWGRVSRRRPRNSPSFFSRRSCSCRLFHSVSSRERLATQANWIRKWKATDFWEILVFPRFNMDGRFTALCTASMAPFARSPALLRYWQLTYV